MEVPGDFDAAYAFDVIEHVDDPFALPRPSWSGGRTSCSSTCSSPGPAEREPASHRELPIPALASHAADSGLRSYSIHHGRSHLRRLRAGEATALGRLRARLAIAAARARRR